MKGDKSDTLYSILLNVLNVEQEGIPVEFLFDPILHSSLPVLHSPFSIL